MKTTIHRADKRGAGEYGWLSTRYSFSFAQWFDPSRMGFGALRVLNDDRIAPAAGFPPHPHADMEIITIVTEGAVAHKDSTGSEGVVREGEVQVMSAGSGVVHSEYNASETEPLSLFQLWILTAKKSAAPRYADRSFNTPESRTLLVAPMDSEEVVSGKALGIHQNAYITRIRIQKDAEDSYILHDNTNGVYIFVASGSVRIGDTELAMRDAIGVEDAEAVAVTGLEDSEILLIEVPMHL